MDNWRLEIGDTRGRVHLDKGIHQVVHDYGGVKGVEEQVEKHAKDRGGIDQKQHLHTTEDTADKALVTVQDASHGHNTNLA